MKKFSLLNLIFLILFASCKAEEPAPKCSFTFKGNKYSSNNVVCFDDPGTVVGVGLSMTVRGQWGVLVVDQRVNYLSMEPIESFPYSYYNYSGVTITRQGNTLDFNGTLSLTLNGILDNGIISGKCTCTSF